MVVSIVKKLIAFLTALVLFAGCLFGLDIWQGQKLASMSGPLNYMIDLRKFVCADAIADSLDENTVLFLGSSELAMRDEKSHPQALLNNGNANLRLMEVGGGYNQSLSHALDVGAYADAMVNKKVVLNLSPQWFTNEHIHPDAFASKFYEQVFDGFMKNAHISNDTKRKIVERCKSLLTSDPAQLERVQMYEDVYLNGSFNIVKRLYLGVHNMFMSFKTKKDLIDALPELQKSEGAPAKIEEVDFDELLEISQQQGEADCTNNPFYVYDEYYTTYIEPSLEYRKDSQKDESYCTSPEYDDLRLFLDVCQETGIEPLLINIPVNGYWYDYTGFPKTDREQYYQNIRDIAAEYGAELLDLSEHEYTPYFLRDIMHLGWKGWAYINEGVYHFVKEDRP